MCAECRAGYNKVNGNCVVCDGLSASTLATNLIFQLLTAVFLVYNSTTTIVTEHEVEDTWDIVDVESSGSLDAEGVRAVLSLMGVEHSSAELHHMLKSVFDAHVQKVSEDEEALVVLKHKFVSVTVAASSPSAAVGTFIFFVQTFGLFMSDAPDTGGFQTVLMIFDFNFEASSGHCMYTFSYVQRYLVQLLGVPIFLCACILSVVAPAYNALRSSERLSTLLHLHRRPVELSIVHVKRAIVGVLMVCYAPTMRSSFEILACIDTCSGNSADCPRVLAADISVECFTGEHLPVAAFAAVVLVAVGLVLPVVLLRMAKENRKLRGTKLLRRVILALFHKVQRTHSEIEDSDEDPLGRAGGDSHHRDQGLRKMAASHGEAGAEHLSTSTAPDTRRSRSFKNRELEKSADSCILHVRGVGQAGPQYFDRHKVQGIFQRYGKVLGVALRRRHDAAGVDTSWALVKMNDQTSTLNALKATRVMAGDTELQVSAFDVHAAGKSTGAMRPVLRELMTPFESPFDILYGTTSVENYWWFAHVLWLKSTICGLFTFGTARLFDWQMFTHLLLATSLALAVTTQPYVSQSDRQAEAFVLLSLAMVSHVSSLLKSTEDATLTLFYVALLVPTPEYNPFFLTGRG
jgi:hypothetical protein